MNLIKDVVGAIFIRDGKLFSAKRKESKYSYISYKYEFVGGKREDGETCEEALVRECQEEMGITIKIIRPCMTYRYDYPDFSIYFHTFFAEMTDEPQLLEHEEFRWIDISDLDENAWAPADGKVLRWIRRNYGDLSEKTLVSNTVFDGYIMKVKKDTVLLPDGKEAFREMIEHKGAAAVLVVDEKDNVYFCRQFRYPVGRIMLEIPAGKRDGFEEAYEETAQRELREELGVIDAELKPLGDIYPTVGYSNEKIALFLATNPVFGEQSLDDDEFLNVVCMPLRDAFALATDGTLQDSKTLVALLKYKAMRERKS